MGKLNPLVDQLNTIREILSHHLPWLHRDFMFKTPGFIKAERCNWATYLTRTIDPENDLRFVFENGSQKLLILSEILPWDSAFFGYPIAKLQLILPYDAPFVRPKADYRAALMTFLEQIRVLGVRYLFASVFPQDIATIQALNQCGFSLIETRVYYHRSLKDYSYPERFPVRLATVDDQESLIWTAVKTINPYDRFHADPFISSRDADRIMAQWIIASLNEGFADAILVPDVSSPTAFCTVKYHKEKWDRWGVRLAQPILSAVSKDFRGWYLKIISELCYHMLEIGAEHNYRITQITNNATIRSWEKLGYQYGRSAHILRLII